MAALDQWRYRWFVCFASDPHTNLLDVKSVKTWTWATIRGGDAPMCCTSRDTDIFISFQPGANKRLTLQIYFNQLRCDLTASSSIFIFVNISKHIYIISTAAGKGTLGQCETTRDSNEGSLRFHNHRKGPYLPSRAFSWLKAPSSAFPFKTLC